MLRLLSTTAPCRDTCRNLLSGEANSALPGFSSHVVTVVGLHWQYRALAWCRRRSRRLGGVRAGVDLHRQRPRWRSRQPRSFSRSHCCSGVGGVLPVVAESPRLRAGFRVVLRWRPDAVDAGGDALSVATSSGAQRCGMAARRQRPTWRRSPGATLPKRNRAEGGTLRVWPLLPHSASDDPGDCCRRLSWPRHLPG